MPDWKTLYIDGDWTPSEGDGRIEVTDPATGEIIGRVPDASPADVGRAVDAARHALEQGPWPRLGPFDRADALERLAAALTARADDLTQVITAESGCPVTITEQVQVRMAIALLPYYAGVIRTRPVEEERPGLLATSRVRKAPIGVVGAIVPWNVPLAGALLKLAPALAAGCTAVLKPSPLTPLSAVVVAEAADEAGLPAGVLNIVPATAEGAASLVAHPGIDKIAFTGSTAVGRRVAAACAERLRPYSLELGGNAASIVLDDAPPDRVAAGLARSAFACVNGQACIAQSRVLVPRRLEPGFTEAIAAAAAVLPVGDPADRRTLVGPLISDDHRRRVLDLVGSGVAEGATLVRGGTDRAEGRYVEPAVLTGVHNGMRVAREEIFGPVVTVIPYDTEDEAVAVADDSGQRLSASVWSADQDRAARVAGSLRAGTVFVNEGFSVELNAPFGNPGAAREGGPDALDIYLETRTTLLPV
jgi:betaine-aldehyde dehydrogenase